MTTIPKTRTYVPGLDDILSGGLPSERTTVLNGGTGVGKTVLGLQIAYFNATHDNPSVFVSLEESGPSIYRNSGSLGWEVDAEESSGRMAIVDLAVDPTAVRTGRFDLGGLRAIIQGSAGELGANLVVIDSLDAALGPFREDDEAEDELVQLLRWFAERSITVLITAKRRQTTEDHDLLDFLADCVIDLDQRVVRQVTTRRLRIVKYRGSGFSSNEHPFVIGDAGIKLMPLTGVELPTGAIGKAMNCGHSALDGILGGGLRRGSSILVAGPTGTGKTTLACMFSLSATSRSERVLYCSLEESAVALADAMKSPGFDLEGALESGSLRILTAMPEATGIEEHLFRIFEAIDSFAPQHLVMDSISATPRMGAESAAFDFLVRIVGHAKERGITCVFTSQTRSDVGLFGMSEIGISSLIDAIISLDYDVVGSELRRTLLVVKNRGSSHSHRYHRFVIGDKGVHIEVEMENER